MRLELSQPMSIRGRVAGLFRNIGFVLALAFTAGLTLSQGATWTSPTVTPLLAVIITLSMMGVSPSVFLNPRKVIRPVLLSIALNYGILTFALIGLSSLIVQDYQLWTGFIILAAVPPAVAVIPFTYRLNGNVDFSLIGTVAGYIAALGIIPFAFITLLGTTLIHPKEVLMTLGELIALPLAISQILRTTGVASKIERYRGQIVNWGFFVVVYTIIGLNQNAFLGQPAILLETSVIAFISTFAIAFLTDHISKLLGVKKPDRVSLVFLATMKNYGLAAAIALALFSPKAAMPSAMATAFAIAHFIWFSFRVKKMGRTTNANTVRSYFAIKK
jgi:BASS family bile acid:Na+ symporter